MYDDYGWRPYVPVAVRRRQAMLEMQKLKKKGHPVSPIVIEGRIIARTFWGKAWCDNLERYSDYENRLPRGRAYVRNGSVVDLQISAGEIKAYVSGSEMYTVSVKVTPVSKQRWQDICADCSGAIDSLVELLQGRFSKGVMERLCQEQNGLFPSPKEIKLKCSCPDWATMCKHVAAVLYGIGARLDEHPELLFRLHKVDEKDLIAKAGAGLPMGKKAVALEKTLAGEDLSAIFGLELAETVDAAAPPAAELSTPAPGRVPKPAPAKRAARKKAKPVVNLKPEKPKQKKIMTPAAKSVRAAKVGKAGVHAPPE